MSQNKPPVTRANIVPADDIEASQLAKQNDEAGYARGVAYALEHIEDALAAAKRAGQRNTTIVLEDLVHTLKLECEE